MTTQAVPTITLSALYKLNPCPSGYAEVSKKLRALKSGRSAYYSAVEAKQAGISLDDMVWVSETVASKDKGVNRRVLLWIADCAARVLHIYEKTGASTSPREAIKATRAFARGEIDKAAWEAAKNAAWAAARTATWSNAAVATWDASWSRDAAGKAAGDAAARDAEESWQYDRLVAWLSNPEPEDWPLPSENNRKRS